MLQLYEIYWLLYINWKDILNDASQVLFSECGATTASETRMSTCRNAVIASMAPHCPLHLANTVGCLNTVEASELFKLDEAKLNSIAQLGIQKLFSNNAHSNRARKKN